MIFAMDLDIIPLPDAIIPMAKISHLAYCAEEWGEYNKGRLVFSVFSLGEETVYALPVNRLCVLLAVPIRNLSTEL